MAASSDEEYARALERQCWGLPGRSACTNMKNGGYDLCTECYQILRRSVPHVQPNMVACTNCTHGYVYLSMQCDNPRCSTNVGMGEDATYEEMMEREQKDRAKLARASYHSKKEEDYFDVTKYHMQAGETAETCVICIEDFTNGEDIARLSCDGAHPFHLHCIKECFKESGMRCPTCNLALAKKA